MEQLQSIIKKVLSFVRPRKEVSSCTRKCGLECKGSEHARFYRYIGPDGRSEVYSRPQEGRELAKADVATTNKK